MSHRDQLYDRLTEVDPTSSGFHWGVVTDIEDPKIMGRIRVRMAWHRDDQMTDWVPRLGGGGSNYGQNGDVPQPGELVHLQYPGGNLYQPHWTLGSWTEGGKGPNGTVPANLPPHLQKGASLYTNPLHKPEQGKFKVWFWKSLAGFFLHIGEGLDWLHFRSPKGFDLKLEHDVPVDGTSKDAAKTNLPYHHLKLTTPTGHTIESTEWAANNQNDLTIQHTAGMSFKITQKPQDGSKEVTLTLDDLVIDLKVASGVKQVSLSAGASE
jgi:hypothetical protein